MVLQLASSSKEIVTWEKKPCRETGGAFLLESARLRILNLAKDFEGLG